MRARNSRLLFPLAVVAIGSCGAAISQGSLAQLRPYPQSPGISVPDVSPTPEAEHAARKAVVGTGFYDPDNPELTRLQHYDEAVASLPKDAVGFPDWMRALREGKINPKAGLESSATMSVLNLDVIMRSTKEMPNVRFPHNSHTQWLDCSNCHPRPFEPRAGAAKIVMADIFRGKYCGMCHDRVAFITFFSCQRCHSVPQTQEAATGPNRLP